MTSLKNGRFFFVIVIQNWVKQYKSSQIKFHNNSTHAAFSFHNFFHTKMTPDWNKNIYLQMLWVQNLKFEEKNSCVESWFGDRSLNKALSSWKAAKIDCKVKAIWVQID